MGKTSKAAAAVQAPAVGGRYLTSRLGAGVFGLEITKVQEIMGLLPVTYVPQMPAFVRGVINLRGHVIPVIDLRLKLGLEPEPDTEKTCIIVVKMGPDCGDLEVGMVVDEVHEVLTLDRGQIDPAPDLGGTINTDFILGMGKAEKKVVILLDVENVVGKQEIEALSQIRQSA